jgi:flagellar protein FliO/FliZ
MNIAPSAATASQGPGLAGVWEVALGLFVVIAAIVVLAWFARRVYPGAVQAGKHLRVLAALPLGARERLLLVEVGGAQLLLGVTPQQVTTLHELREPLELGAPPGGEFADRLREILARGRAP